MMRKFLSEPLVHFLVIGAVLFIIFGMVNDGGLRDLDNQVVVSAGRIEQLESIFAKTWQRPPSANERKGLIDDFVLEEIYYRQAVEMGIDRDDTVIRRRLRQKLEFLTDDMAAVIKPTDDDLAAYLASNADTFVRDTNYTFDQVYINPEQPGMALDAHVAELLLALKEGDSGAGDGGLLPFHYEAASSRVVDGSFGLGFSQKLDGLKVGEWQGPVESGLGLHLVLLESRVAGTLPELAEIRSDVEREWANDKRLETRRLINDQLVTEYEVVIDWPVE
jgi:hypothetical protein